MFFVGRREGGTGGCGGSRQTKNNLELRVEKSFEKWLSSRRCIVIRIYMPRNAYRCAMRAGVPAS